IDRKGGQYSFYAIDYAARLSMEMGADVVKLNLPKIDPDKDKDAPAPYNEMEVTQEAAVRQVVSSAGRSLVVLSVGSKFGDEHRPPGPTHRPRGRVALFAGFAGRAELVDRGRPARPCRGGARRARGGYGWIGFGRW